MGDGAYLAVATPSMRRLILFTLWRPRCGLRLNYRQGCLNGSQRCAGWTPATVIPGGPNGSQIAVYRAIELIDLKGELNASPLESRFYQVVPDVSPGTFLACARPLLLSCLSASV